MRYLLDTNVVSDATKPQPSPALLAWLADRHATELYIASLTLAEIRRGILRLPTGRKRRDLEKWFDSPEGPPRLFSGRILPFDETSALVWAHLMSEGEVGGRPRDEMDMIIAATAQTNSCTVVTSNKRDFYGVDVFDPTEIG